MYINLINPACKSWDFHYQPQHGCFGSRPKVAEATESRLRRQAEQEETARRRAEEAQQRAKKRHLGRLEACGCFQK